VLSSVSYSAQLSQRAMLDEISSSHNCAFLVVGLIEYGLLDASSNSLPLIRKYQSTRSQIKERESLSMR